MGIKPAYNLLFVFIFSLFFCISINSQQFVWHQLGGPMGGIIGDLAINSEGNIYAGVYSFMGTSFQFEYYSGIYKSTDNGDTWDEMVTPFDPFEIYALYITEGNDILVGTNHQGRIYRSTDGGETWENNNSGYDTGECWAFGESNDGVLFAGSGEGEVYKTTDYGNNWEFSGNLAAVVFATDTNNEVYCGTLYGLYKTTDNGLNWLMNISLADTAVSSILIDDSNNVYIGTGYYDSGNGVYYSTNSGGNWTHLGLKGKVVLSLAFDSKGNLYAGTKQDGLFKTTDRGLSWTQYQNGISGIEIFRLKINNQDEIFIGSEDEGVFRSTDGGESFKEVGLPISNIRNIDFSTDKNLIFTSTPSGVQEYNRTTGIWKNKGLREVEAVSVSPSGDLYAATYVNGLYRSTNYGDSWEKMTKVDEYRYNFKAATDSVLIDATFPAFRISTDQGNSWDTTDINVSFNRNSILYKNGKNVTYLQGYREGSKIFYTPNFGMTFSEISVPSSFNNKNGIAVNSIEDVFFTSVENQIYGIYRFSYPYANGSKLYTGNVYCIFIDSMDNIFAGVDDGILRSTNNGNDWNYIFTENMPRTYAQDLKIEENTLFIVTNSYGLYELQIPTDVKSENDIVKGYKLYQNYPNPFNPSTSIKYAVSSKQLVTLKVYNVLGNEIATLVNEEKLPGDYEVEFIPISGNRHLASGIYFYKLQAGNYSSTKKMIYLK